MPFVCKCCIAQAPPCPNQAHVPLLFGCKGSFENAEPLSQDALRALIATKGASYIGDQFRKDPKLDLNQYFGAPELDISGTGTIALVVAGDFPLSGADSGGGDGSAKIYHFNEAKYVLAQTLNTYWKY